MIINAIPLQLTRKLGGAVMSSDKNDSLNEDNVFLVRTEDFDLLLDSLKIDPDVKSNQGILVEYISKNKNS